jgi:hypothetical protein
MMYKAALPVLLLLLVAGQLSADFCMAQCQSMRMMKRACAMHEMAEGHCGSCKHRSASGTSASLSTPGTCSGQTCNSNVLGLFQIRCDDEIKPFFKAASCDVDASPILNGTHQARCRDARSTKSIPSFDPLISSLRI